MSSEDIASSAKLNNLPKAPPVGMPKAEAPISVAIPKALILLTRLARDLAFSNSPLLPSTSFTSASAMVSKIEALASS